MGKQTMAVFGLFKTRSQVDAAVGALEAAGFRNSDISVLFADGDQTKTFAHERHTKAPEGAAAGAGTGLAIGGALGWLVGVGALVIPGIGPIIAAGPIMAALAGAGIGSAVGGVTGALVGLGVPEYEAKRYETFVTEGGILMSVHVDDGKWRDKAKAIIERAGATDVDDAPEAGPLMSDDDELPRVRPKVPLL